MKRIPHLLAVSVPAIVAVMLSACTSPQGASQMRGGSASQGEIWSGDGPVSGPGYMQGGTGQMGIADQETQCSVYRRMMAARTPEERQALMDPRMRSMSPEMQQRHLQMMGERCK